jgi:EAL domain-containing protein (putative c-di-GMP-specific phosphodiesterase class I)
MTIAVDDFGAEYSSLNYISSLPIDTLKLDREMNLMFLERAKPAAMEVLLEFIHSLDLVIVAEGIESMEHVKRLKTAGCDIIQGYCFSRPIEVDEIMEVDGTIYPLT